MRASGLQRSKGRRSTGQVQPLRGCVYVAARQVGGDIMHGGVTARPTKRAPVVNVYTASCFSCQSLRFDVVCGFAA